MFAWKDWWKNAKFLPLRTNQKNPIILNGKKPTNNAKNYRKKPQFAQNLGVFCWHFPLKTSDYPKKHSNKAIFLSSKYSRDVMISIWNRKFFINWFLVEREAKSVNSAHSIAARSLIFDDCQSKKRRGKLHFNNIASIASSVDKDPSIKLS